MLAVPTLLLALAAAEPTDLAEPAARAELDACADRIEALKSRREAGRELDRLLRRAQELAAELERTAAELPAAPAAPAPEELRERADAARDEADRLSAEIAALDVRINDARRGRGDPDGPIAGAALGAPVPRGDPARALLAERVALAARRARAVAEATRLEREARAAEEDR
jgi:hypothetical protein